MVSNRPARSSCMSKKRAAYYVVWQGRTPGIYDSWEACEAQVKGAEGARYKGFATLPEAQQAFAASPDDYIVKKVPTTNEALTGLTTNDQRLTTKEALTGPTTNDQRPFPILSSPPWRWMLPARATQA